MIDHEVRLDLGIHLRGYRFVPGHADDRCSHGCQIDDRRNTGEVLKNDTRRLECDLVRADLRCVILGGGPNVLVPHHESIVIAQGGLQQHLDGVRQRVDVPHVLE